LSQVHKHRFVIILGFAILVGLALRLALIVRSGWRIDYDEAMIGLLGLRVLRGQWMAFIPAQPTLGAIEAYLLAPVFAILGAGPVTFRLVSLALAAAYIASTGLVARRAYGERAGGLAALLASIAPPYMLITSLRTWGATIETIILGNLLLLAVADLTPWPPLQIWRGGNSKNHWKSKLLLTGLIAGVMFWIAWLGFYYFIPAALVLLVRGRRVLARGWWLMGIGFLVGSLPFWIFNLSHSFATVSTALGGGAMTGAERSAVLEHAWVDLLPRLVSGDPAWQVSGPRGLSLLQWLYYGGALSLLAWPLLRRPFPQRGASARWMLAIFVLAVPAVYLFTGYSRNALNPWGLDATGRYVVMLHTALPIGVAALASAISTRKVKFTAENAKSVEGKTNSRLFLPAARTAGLSIVLVVLGLNGLGALRLDPLAAFASPYYDRLPASLEPLIEALDAHGIRYVWTDIGLGQVLTFETNERIIAADYHDAAVGGLVRFPDALEAVKTAPLAAFAYPIMAGQTAPPIQRALDAAGVPYTAIQVTPTLMLYIPDRRVDPSTVAQGLGYQY
jgi:hypothetical protein